MRDALGRAEALGRSDGERVSGGLPEGSTAVSVAPCEAEVESRREAAREGRTTLSNPLLDSAIEGGRDSAWDDISLVVDRNAVVLKL